MTRWVLVLVLALVSSGLARADSPRLAAARQAIDEIRYDDARALLVQTLGQGGATPAELVELYQLSAVTAAVLGDVGLAEQYYRRMLALEPGKTLPADASPRLRAPFIAAQAYMAAQPRFEARAARTRGGIEVSVTDPLRMVAAVGARALGTIASRQPFAGAPVTLADDGAEIALLDEHGNVLSLLALPPREAASEIEPARRTPVLRRATTWAIPALVLGGASTWLFVDALLAKRRLDDIVANDRMYFFDQAEAERTRWRDHLLGGYLTAVLAVGLTTTAVVMATRRPDTVRVTPSVQAGSAGLLLESKF